MEVKVQSGTGESARRARIAWLVSCVVPMTLIALLLAVEPSHASPTPVAGASSLEEEAEAQVEGEDEGEASEDQECLEAEAEFAAGELSQEELDEYCEDEAERDAAAKAAGLLPEECLLRSFDPRVAFTAANKVQLTLRYTAYEPAAATLEYGLLGGKGSLRVETTKHQLGRSGVIRLTRSLSDSEMEKLGAAGRFTIRLHAAEAPTSCRPLETERVILKRASKARSSARRGRN